jgi:two-component system response regulator AtoC
MLLNYSDTTCAAGGEVGSLALNNRIFISGVSPEMQAVQRLISEIAPTDIPVLLAGESGTGKEVAALQIHGLSEFRGLPFRKLTCAAFTQETFQTELHRFVDGDTAKNGRINGTLFFDEVSELDGNCQRWLLHSLPDGEGLPARESITGRVLSCTARDIESDVQAGRFRSELFYRLNGVCLRLPPLRRRKEDIPLFVEFFLRKYAKLFDRATMSLSDSTHRALTDYSWPGNIRELENIVKKIVALESEELVVSELRAQPAPSRASDSPADTCSLKAVARAASHQAERQLILQTLARTRWNRKRAAEALQISYKSLLCKLKQIRLPGSEGV